MQFTGNVVRDVEAGVNILGFDDGYPSRQTNTIVVRDNLFDGVGGGYFLLMTHSPRSVVIDHNTIIASKFAGLCEIEDQVEGFAFTNNITAIGDYGIIATARGPGNDSIHANLPGAAISANVLAGGSSSAYPPGNFFPVVGDLQLQFVNPALHDFRLKPTSPWAHSGTDGQDPGANGPNGEPLLPRQPQRR